MRFVVLVVLGLAGIAAVAVYLEYGTVEPCNVLREKMRRQAAREGGDLGGFVASVIPDNLFNAAISAQYNRPVTPGLCIGILAGYEQPVDIRAAARRRQ
jgi:hypothetical protein